MENIKFAIVMATYNRENASSKKYIKRCIDSIINQIYIKWDLIVVGDKFEPEIELINIINDYKKILNHENNLIYLKNDNPERNYIKNKYLLWNIAGASSMNIGLEYCRKNGYKYYCHIDDDDFWDKTHLLNFYEIYKNYPNCIFSNSQSTYPHKKKYIPINKKLPIIPNNLIPKSLAMVHSSISFRIDIIPFYYFTTINENEINIPSDAIMLDNINNFLKENKQYCSIYTCKLTCYHDLEGELKG